MTRQREQYWLKEYLDRLLATSPRPTFDCMVFGPYEEAETNLLSIIPAAETHHLYDMLILQLGSFTRYVLYVPGELHHRPLKRGEVIPCQLFQRSGVPQSPYLLLPDGIDLSVLPSALSQQIGASSPSIRSRDDFDKDSVDQIPVTTLTDIEETVELLDPQS